MKLHKLILALVVLTTLCGCSPDLEYLQKLHPSSIVEICIDGKRYSADAETIGPMLQAWLRSGLEGFGTSLVTYVPDVCFSYEYMNSARGLPWLVLGDVNFTEGCVVVNEIRHKGSEKECSQYVRDATEADRQFRAFILRCIAKGKFKLLEPELHAQGLEKLK